jgi:hypothetical protein
MAPPCLYLRLFEVNRRPVERVFEGAANSINISLVVAFIADKQNCFVVIFIHKATESSSLDTCIFYDRKNGV